MTAEENNKALVAAAYEGFGRGDLGPIFSMLADDVVWTNHATSAAPFSGEYKGAAGVQQFFEALDAIEITHFDFHTLVAEGDIVVGLGDTAYTVKATGKSAAGPLVHVLRMENGKLVRFDEFEHADDVW